MFEVGNTPLVEVEGIYSKLECVNPCGSVKDRIAKYIIDESERRGMLRPGMTIVEATSGNTGIAFAYYAREKGYSITIVMPNNMTNERKDILRSLGAHLILCSDGNFKEAAEIRDALANSDGKKYFNPDQFSNPLNVECHYITTGQEILRDMGERSIDAFVVGVGTGGTLIGVGKALREINGKVRLVAVEPLESAVMSGGLPGGHGIPGIGDGFIPAIASDGKGGLNEMIDEVIAVLTEEAEETSKYLIKNGFCVGISSGANFVAAKRLQERFKTVVTVFPDGYAKYVSRGLTPSNKSCVFEQDRVNVLTGRKGSCD